MYRFVINKRYIKFFMELGNKTLTVREISKKTDTHYAHISTVVGQFAKEGIIATENVKNTLEISLTKKGKACAHHLFKINNIMLNWKEPGEKQPSKPKSKLESEQRGTMEELATALKTKEGENNE